MLQKSRRIKRGNFVAHGRQRLSSSSSLLSVVVYINKRDSEAKFACVMGGGVSKHKPRRNKIRRQLSHLFKLYEDKLPLNIEIIAFPKNKSLEADFGSIKKEFQALLVGLKLLKSDN